MAALPAFMMIGGGVVSAIGSIQQGQAQAQAARMNADVANQNAAAALQQGAEEERRQRIMGRKQLGAIRAGYAASGITMDGSAQDVMEDSAAAAEMDALTSRYNGTYKAYQYQQQASVDLLAADNAQKSAGLATAGGILKAGTGAAMMYPGSTKLTRTEGV